MHSYLIEDRIVKSSQQRNKIREIRRETSYFTIGAVKHGLLLHRLSDLRFTIATPAIGPFGPALEVCKIDVIDNYQRRYTSQPFRWPDNEFIVRAYDPTIFI